MRWALVFLVVVSILLLMTLNKTGYVVRDNVKEVTIFAEKWEFVPNEVVVKKGDMVKLKLVTSEQNETFGFKLSKYMYDRVIVIEPNMTKYFDFNAYLPGTYVYRCENPCGFGKNLMIGKLTVEPY